MTNPMSSLLEEISREHFPYPPATPEEIADFERRAGWTLDPDMRAFYLHCNGAELIERLPDSPYQVLPLSEIIRARVAIFGKRNDDDGHGPASVYALCDVQDGNYVLVDVSREEEGRYPLFDGDHEAWPDPAYCKQIASSFSEFLAQVLRTRRGLYWLGE
ncbi:SMI1/KNR4 family protein [Archangium violaceum]|uniref:SMI1/KNR4 family protein n=1 Tax=Archangium violaceum TaxID=83451 RepID=UPI002B2D58C8|nr:SMI1/KNR4 family protein [Archangium violaceum]